jgi:hypothetical protein
VVVGYLKSYRAGPHVTLRYATSAVMVDGDGLVMGDGRGPDG